MDTTAPPPCPALPELADAAAWRALGGGDTAAEIARQPELWDALVELLEPRRDALEEFIGARLDEPMQRVLFTGAGSSGFVAELVAGALETRHPCELRAIHTTSLLTHPARYLRAERPTLLVSFGRSGSSPESIAAIDIVRNTVAGARFLNITCNADGELARQGQTHADTFTLLMPEASCDRAFAMTSSLSCMLLAALTLFEPAPWPQRVARLPALARMARTALAQWADPVHALAQTPFGRVVYLGSGPLEALAREAALKLVELSAGRVLALPNTPLGFRHGPKSALTGNTLVVVFRSSEPLARRYEQDLLDELRRDGIAARVLSIGPQTASARNADAADDDDLALPLAAEVVADDVWLAPVWLLFAQLVALYRSAVSGLTADNPFPDGSVNRVVQGVTIHHD